MKNAGILSEDVAAWVDITPADKAALKIEKARATPSPKLFTLKGDSNNAPCHCEAIGKEDVAAGAAESVSFLKKIGFTKAA